MKRILIVILAAGLVAAGVAACKSKAPRALETKGDQAAAAASPASVTPGGVPSMPAGRPSMGMGGQGGTGIPGAVPAKTGKVVETMNAGGYTYVRVDTGKEKLWAAAPQFDVKVGEKVTVPEGMPMTNFKSNSLNRTFEIVYFVPVIGKGDHTPAMTSPPAMAQPVQQQHPVVDASTAAKTANVSFAGITKPAGGKSIEEIFAAQANLSGKEVVLRGKVVKFNPQIMGKNWIHLQDGTGKAGSNDLTVTTATTAKVGDTVLVKGNIATNKDFGFGYKYSVIVENAQVTVE